MDNNMIFNFNVRVWHNKLLTTNSINHACMAFISFTVGLSFLGIVLSFYNVSNGTPFLYKYPLWLNLCVISYYIYLLHTHSYLSQADVDVFITTHAWTHLGATSPCAHVNPLCTSLWKTWCTSVHKCISFLMHNLHLFHDRTRFLMDSSIIL